jgi:hypothetical protein
MIYRSSFINNGQSIKKLLHRIDMQTYTHRQQDHFIILLLAFENEESGLNSHSGGVESKWAHSARRPKVD